MQTKYRVLVVDDSSFMRRFISDIIQADKELQVVGTAINGIDAVEKTRELRPDVVTMDIEMPEMDGLAALENIMHLFPTPVIMLSSRTKVGADATLKALELGAVDFIAKPSGNISLDLDKIQDEIIVKVKIAAQCYHRMARLSGSRGADSIATLPNFHNGLPLRRIVAVGTSTGGPRALQAVLSKIPGNVPAAFTIVQHMPKGFTKSLAERLNSVSQLTVSEANEGDELVAGRVLISPGDRHMLIRRAGDRLYVTLSDEPPVQGLRPSVDKMMESLVECGVPVTGVLLTGMGYDGVAGLKKIQAASGYTIAEDESTCVVYGMPRAALENNCVHKVVPLHQISHEIVSNL